MSNDRPTKISTGQVEDLRLSLRKSGREKRKVENKYPAKEKEFAQESTKHRKRHLDVVEDGKLAEQAPKGEGKAHSFCDNSGDRGAEIVKNRR